MIPVGVLSGLNGLFRQIHISPGATWTSHAFRFLAYYCFFSILRCFLNNSRVPLLHSLYVYLFSVNAFYMRNQEMGEQFEHAYCMMFAAQYVCLPICVDVFRWDPAVFQFGVRKQYVTTSQLPLSKVAVNKPDIMDWRAIFNSILTSSSNDHGKSAFSFCSHL